MAPNYSSPLYNPLYNPHLRSLDYGSVDPCKICWALSKPEEAMITGPCSSKNDGGISRVPFVSVPLYELLKRDARYVWDVDI